MACSSTSTFLSSKKLNSKVWACFKKVMESDKEDTKCRLDDRTEKLSYSKVSNKGQNGL